MNAASGPNATLPRPLEGPGQRPDTQPRPPRLRSQALFAGGHEIEIQHGEAVYRLRITSLGKLILTK